MVLKMKDFFLFKAEQGYIVPTHIHHALYFPIYLLVDYLGYLGLSWLSWTIKIHILAAKINVIKNTWCYHLLDYRFYLDTQISFPLVIYPRVDC